MEELRQGWSIGRPDWWTSKVQSNDNIIYVYGDPKYAAATVTQRGNSFYVQHYGCDIHCSSTLIKAQLFAETYLSPKVSEACRNARA